MLNDPYIYEGDMHDLPPDTDVIWLDDMEYELIEEPVETLPPEFWAKYNYGSQIAKQRIDTPAQLKDDEIDWQVYHGFKKAKSCRKIK